MTIRIGIVGMGGIGNQHARCYMNNPGAELVAVCDVVKEKADEAAEKYGARAFYSLKEMLASDIGLDVVDVTTSGFENGSWHYEPAMEALQAGKHVFVEKPISNDIREAREMVQYAYKNDLYLACNLNHYFTEPADRAKQLIADGKIGQPIYLLQKMGFNGSEMTYGGVGSPRWQRPYSHLKAFLAHPFSIMRYFGGDIEEVHCFAMTAPGRNIYSTASINMKFKCGAVGHLTSSYDIARGHPMERCEVAGTNGRLVFEDMWREATLYPAGNYEKRVYTNPVFGGFESFYDTFKDRINSFVDEVKRDVKPEDIDGSGKAGLEATRVIHAAIKSLKTGLPVKVEEVHE